MIKTIKQLVNEGYPEAMLRQISHQPESPFFRINPRGKFAVDEDELKEHIDRIKSQEVSNGAR